MIHKKGPVKFVQTPSSEWPLPAFHFDEPSVVLEKGTKGTFEEFGVRDPALLEDEDGNLIVDKDHHIHLFYTGSREPLGFVQSTGRVRSADQGKTWQRFQSDAVLSPRPEEFDKFTASTPWCIKRKDGRYALYYRGVKEHGKEDAVGVAFSDDGINFTPHDKPIMRMSDFKGMHQGKALMGVMHALVTHQGKYLVTFESFRADNGAAAIFGGLSDDGIHFVPANDGQPIFSGDHATSWYASWVANPRLTRLDNPRGYLLTYNGYWKNGEYALALAFSTDLKTWIDYPGNPIIIPRSIPDHDPFSGRLEGLCLVKEDVVAKSAQGRSYFMSIPKRGPTHKNGVVGMSSFSMPEKMQSFASTGNVTADETHLKLQAGTVMASAHFALDASVKTITCKFKNNGKACFTLAPDRHYPHLALDTVLWLDNEKAKLNRLSSLCAHNLLRKRRLAGLYRCLPLIAPFTKAVTALSGWNTLTISMTPSGLTIAVNGKVVETGDKNRDIINFGMFAQSGTLEMTDIEFA